MVDEFVNICIFAFWEIATRLEVVYSVWLAFLMGGSAIIGVYDVRLTSVHVNIFGFGWEVC